MSSITSQEEIWPGDRNPSRHDVEVATELLEPAFLSDFKKALLAHPDAEDTRDLMHLNLKNCGNGGKTFTYPMVWLSALPEIPAQEELSHLQEAFLKLFPSHVFVNLLPIAQATSQPPVPPFRFGVACLASVHCRRPVDESRNLCLAGIDLWAFMTEVDNRQARSLDMFMAIIFLAMYGITTADETIRRKTGIITCTCLTIARRMRLHDPRQLEPLLEPRGSTYRSAFVWSAWLLDTLYALHLDLAVNTFSSRELWTTMPSSSYEFQDLYHILINQGDTLGPLPPDLTAPDDALLLLVAILSDMLLIRRSLKRIVDVDMHPDTRPQGRISNPFVPLTPHTELDGMHSTSERALDRWHDRFQSRVPPEIMAFYHYCRLFLCYAELLDLPRIAGYKPLSAPFKPTHQDIIVPDQGIRMAWLILDNAAERVKSPASDILCPVWLPIMVFHAGLAVWAQQRQRGHHRAGVIGSARVLVAFKVELESMPWSSCPEMAATLDELMKSLSRTRRDTDGLAC